MAKTATINVRISQESLERAQRALQRTIHKVAEARRLRPRSGALGAHRALLSATDDSGLTELLEPTKRLMSAA